MVTYIPVVEAVSVVKTDEDVKEKLLFTTQIAVKQIQQYSSENTPADGLTTGVHEVHQLCDSIDKTLLYGLRECQAGYWPFVKDFTHNNTITYIETVNSFQTEIQLGRRWLCLALSENGLESYFRSFQQNPHMVRKYYAAPALLRDEQCMQVLLMLMAGLENVPLSLDIEKIKCGSGLSFVDSEVCSGMNRTPSTCSSEFSQGEYIASITRDAFRDCDSGVIAYENAVEADSDSSSQVVHKSSSSDMLSDQNSCTCHDSQQDMERITKYLNMPSEQQFTSSAADLEVVRTKVVRRVKKSALKTENGPQAYTRDCVGNLECCKEHRLSKATTDSGLSLETHTDSSDRDSPELRLDNTKRSFTFDVSDFSHDINIKFSTPCLNVGKQRNQSAVEKCLFAEARKQLWYDEERGDPEGREDPKENTCSSQSAYNRKPLLPGNDGIDVQEDEEISIYDIGKESCFSLDDNESIIQKKDEEDGRDESQNSVDVEDAATVVAKSPIHEAIEKAKLEDPVAIELALLSEAEIDETLDVKLGNNTLLCLLVDVYQQDENDYKTFYSYLTYSNGCDHLGLVHLTNRCLHILKTGNDEKKFIVHDSVSYEDIQYIMVHLNYQGFTIVGKRRKLSLFTADEYLTRSIMSSLEVAIRRWCPKRHLPGVSTLATFQEKILKHTLASKLKCLEADVQIHHFVLSRWDYSHGPSPPITPAGPKHEGPLMYRHWLADGSSIVPWSAGNFILNGGFLYCMEEERHNVPLFFLQMCYPHCRGCRRLHLPKRPYSFEVILTNGDSLQLAAADEYEASNWQQAFLQAVSIAGHFIDSDEEDPIPCHIVLFNDSIVAVVEVPDKSCDKFLGIANICDLTAVYTESTVPACVLLEFEIVEATESCGDWILIFETQMEKDKFIDVLKWRLEVLNIVLQIRPVKSLSLVRKLQKREQDIASKKQCIRDFCYED